jgi:hypothetical protein
MGSFKFFWISFVRFIKGSDTLSVRVLYTFKSECRNERCESDTCRIIFMERLISSEVGFRTSQCQGLIGEARLDRAATKRLSNSEFQQFSDVYVPKYLSSSWITLSLAGAFCRRFLKRRQS